MASARSIGVVIMFLAVVLSGCDPHDGYDDRTEEYTTVLSSDVHHLVDNGYMADTNTILIPYESSPDYFYCCTSGGDRFPWQLWRRSERG